MLIKITDVVSSEVGRKALVHFVSNVGNAVGEWMGNDPVIDQIYDVELAISEDLLWDTNIFITAEGIEWIRQGENESVVICGELDVTKDGFCTIKIAGSFISCKFREYSDQLRTSVVVKVDRLLLYDTNI